MEGSGEVDSGYSEAESMQLKMDLQAYVTSGFADDEQRELVSCTITNALANPATSERTALEMIAAHDTLTIERTQEFVLYAYYSLLREAAAMYPDTPMPQSLITFVEQQATELEEFSIVVELGMMNPDVLDMFEQPAGPMELFKEHVHRKHKELDAYVGSLTSDVYRRYSEAAAEFASCDGESYQYEKEIMEKHRCRPERLRNAIAAGQMRTNQGMAAARLQHDCEMISQHAGSLDDQKSDIAQRLLLTPEGRTAIIVQYEYGLINDAAGDPERYKLLLRKDLRTLAAKSLAAALYDKYLFDKASGDMKAIQNNLANHRFVSKQGKDTARQIAHGSSI